MPSHRELFFHSWFRQSCARAYCAVVSASRICSSFSNGVEGCWGSFLLPFSLADIGCVLLEWVPVSYVQYDERIFIILAKRTLRFHGGSRACSILRTYIHFVGRIQFCYDNDSEQDLFRFSVRGRRARSGYAGSRRAGIRRPQQC